MCGRYVSPDDAAIEREFNLVRTEWQFPANYNVAPTAQVPIVRAIDGERRGARVRWGLIPFWAKGVPPVVKGTKRPLSTFNAKIEYVKTKPTWSPSWKQGRRCILPALGFYEWQEQEDKTTKPFYIHTKDQKMYGFAGLWDRSTQVDGTVVESCTMILVPPNPLLKEIHNRKDVMPAILASADREAWLAGSPDEAWEVLKTYPNDRMTAWPVGPLKDNNPSLIEPVRTPFGDALDGAP